MITRIVRALLDVKGLPRRIRHRLDRRSERTVTVRNVAIRMRTSTRRERSRINSYCTKEPATLDWIDRSIQSGQVFYDIGANIGQYAIYAAIRNKGNIHALCFEPESSNFAALNQNITLNQLSVCVRAYPVGIAEETRVGLLQVRGGLNAGEALHRFAAVRPDDHYCHAQGAVTLSLDDLVYRFGLPCPNHMKIDVDGLENAVVGGATRLLGDSRLLSVLIEIDENADELRRTFTDRGFSFIEERRAAPGMNIMNVVFARV